MSFFNQLKNKSGEGGIRTRETLLEFTHFPGARLRPLGHLSKKTRPKLEIIFHKIYFSVSSPLIFFLSSCVIVLLSEYCPNKKNSLAAAASVVQSLPPITPIFFRDFPVE